MDTTIATIRMRDDEWSSQEDGRIMENIAQEYFENHPDKAFVEVYEHAGWWLVFNRELRIVGTANDMARCEGPYPTAHSGEYIYR